MAQNHKTTARTRAAPHPASSNDDFPDILWIENVRRIIRASVTTHACAGDYGIALKILGVATDTIRISTTENVDAGDCIGRVRYKPLFFVVRIDLRVATITGVDVLPTPTGRLRGRRVR